MSIVRARPRSMTEAVTTYCAGCGHGIVHRILGECVDELDLAGKLVGVAPVGCAVNMYDLFDLDYVEVAHGRAPAVATGLKMALPDHFILVYQGDGDLASIGMAEIVHAVNRGLPLTFVFVNNAVYGMTGGQMAPTTLVGQKTATSPRGRDVRTDGYPIRMCELLATLDGAVYLERTKVNTPADVNRTRKAIRKAFEVQLAGRGAALVEVLAMCPTNWHMDPVAALDFVETMAATFPVGVIKDTTGK
jgi:2-oxoglutarate/2-oxoacid ferredoxin oxidoreductase subunit beta